VTHLANFSYKDRYSFDYGEPVTPSIGK